METATTRRRVPHASSDMSDGSSQTHWSYSQICTSAGSCGKILDSMKSCMSAQRFREKGMRIALPSPICRKEANPGLSQKNKCAPSGKNDGPMRQPEKKAKRIRVIAAVSRVAFAGEISEKT
jgi:hypothetical protein